MWRFLVDERTLAELAPDIEPYRQLALDAVMPAHVHLPGGRFAPCGFLAGLDRQAAQ